MSDLTDAYAQMALRRLAADLMRERDTLRTRLAAVERERDEAVKALAELREASGTNRWAGDVRIAVKLAAERDAAVQRAERAEQESAHLRKVPERIVAWLDDDTWTVPSGALRDFGLQAFDALGGAFRELFAGLIRTGAWRGKGTP